MADYGTGIDLDQLRSAAEAKLAMQSARARNFQLYYDGEAGIIALLDTEERMTFRTFLAEAGANWCELIVNAVAERLQVVGFRFDNPDDSDLAWELWQASSMDSDAELVQTDALVMGSSYLLVQPDEDNPTGVSISVESPLQTTVLYEPGNRRKRIAGYKRWAGLEYEFGVMPTTMAPAPTIEVLITPDLIVTWTPGNPPLIEDNPAGVVNLIEVVPQPRTLWWPRSELTPALPIQDRINTTIFNRMVATDYGAFRQIWATGIRLARETITAEDGTSVMRVLAPLQIGANRLLTNENPEGHFGSFAESTLAGYLSSVEQDVNQLAAITQTPPHYLLGQIVNIAADAIKAAETGLVSKCRRRSLHIGEAYEEAMRLALQLVGSSAATDLSAEVIWADMETRSEGQRVDALVKMASLGVPREVLWQKWGASPQEIERWKDMADAEPVAPPAQPGAPILAPGQVVPGAPGEPAAPAPAPPQ